MPSCFIRRSQGCCNISQRACPGGQTLYVPHRGPKGTGPLVPSLRAALRGGVGERPGIGSSGGLWATSRCLVRSDATSRAMDEAGRTRCCSSWFSSNSKCKTLVWNWMTVGLWATLRMPSRRLTQAWYTHISDAMSMEADDSSSTTKKLSSLPLCRMTQLWCQKRRQNCRRCCSPKLRTSAQAIPGVSSSWLCAFHTSPRLASSKSLAMFESSSSSRSDVDQAG
mmetsp:Transcript_1210/g.4037  ORF Transcript_1210/g.4037 Transcript_1210/m.4037 type:complete len:224 (-) Transcript_1210:268-939(-)